ncbi:hypothetical protein [Bifidobacterium saguinibicoloris]|uniref:hypothetical protein n=1 Tax=Bifidobacterium saguinibicoloris TaxID=2834433 RepID=UPI001C565136|nr:hypothetical protein [Bifidobacterium saguinibicoloris]MBW3080607.1 hypothetical protein [Bifidobacterium saguinibicoloris]
MRNRLLVVCVVIAVCVVVEAALRWPAVFHMSYLLMPLVAIASLAVLAARPRTGAWLVAMVTCVGLVSPFPMSYSFLIAMVPAVMIIWRDGRWAAVLVSALAATALLVDRRVLFGFGVSDSAVIAFAYLMCAMLIAVLSRWQSDRLHARERARRRCERERVAATLHDRATNDLANAVMRINADLDSEGFGFDERQSAELRGIRDMIRHAMTATYQAIDTLDASDADVRHPMDDAGPRPETDGSPRRGTKRRV